LAPGYVDTKEKAEWSAGRKLRILDSYYPPDLKDLRMGGTGCQREENVGENQSPGKKNVAGACNLFAESASYSL